MMQKQALYECYKNGVPQGTQFTNVRTDTGWTFCVTDYDNTTVSTFEINFGQKPFKLHHLRVSSH